MLLDKKYDSHWETCVRFSANCAGWVKIKCLEPTVINSFAIMNFQETEVANPKGLRFFVKLASNRGSKFLPRGYIPETEDPKVRKVLEGFVQVKKVEDCDF